MNCVQGVLIFLPSGRPESRYTVEIKITSAATSQVLLWRSLLLTSLLEYKLSKFLSGKLLYGGAPDLLPLCGMGSGHMRLEVVMSQVACTLQDLVAIIPNAQGKSWSLLW